MKITKDAHLDHGLLPEHIAFIEKRFAERDAFFIETFELPANMPTVSCGLWGPLMGDPPVTTEEVVMKPRGERAGPSRLISREPRATLRVTVIAGEHQGEPCVLYTAFGGPVTPREPWDPALSPEQVAESQKFWSEHALSE
jgi:hypothetical protein